MRNIAFTQYPETIDDGYLLETYIVETDASHDQIETCVINNDYPNIHDLVDSLIKHNCHAKIVCKADAFYDYLNDDSHSSLR